MTDVHTAREQDLSQRPVSFMIGWGFPILIFLSMNFARGVLPYEAIILVLSGTLAWMGIGCLINALRCRRRHCYLAGPVFLSGAIGVLLIGFKIINLGQDGLMYVTLGTFGLVGLTFVPEWVWGRYRDT